MTRLQRQTARLVLLKAWQSYGTSAFAVDPHGAHWDALHDAEKAGWVSFVGRRCRIVDEGVRELRPWGAVVSEPSLSELSELEAAE